MRGCADNVRVEVHLDDFLTEPIILLSGSGSNKIEININEWGNVSYNWVKKTWSTYCSNAWDTVKSITKSVLGRIVSWFGSLFGSNNKLEGSSRRYLTYWPSSTFVNLKTFVLVFVYTSLFMFFIPTTWNEQTKLLRKLFFG